MNQDNLLALAGSQGSVPSDRRGPRITRMSRGTLLAAVLGVFGVGPCVYALPEQNN